LTIINVTLTQHCLCVSLFVTVSHNIGHNKIEIERVCVCVFLLSLLLSVIVIGFMHSSTSWTSASAFVSCFPLLDKLINPGVSDYCCCDYWGQAHLDWLVCPIMADRKQM